MATQTIISGYIESLHKYAEYNQDCINTFTEEPQPISTIAGYPVEGFGATIFPIGCIKNLKETEWNNWISNFEKLIYNLKAFSVKLFFESSDSDIRKSFEYINVSISHTSVGNKWKKYVSILNEDIIEESELTRF